MLELFSIPTWDSLHPLVIHFPIVLLFLSPVFILIGAILPPPRGQPYMVAALIILLLGTGSLFLASATGEAAAARLVTRGGPVDAILAVHKEFAGESKVLFSILSAIFLGMTVLMPRLFKREETRVTSTFLPLAFLVLYCAGLLFVVSAAQAGGRIVHEFQVHAIIPAGNPQPNATPAAAKASPIAEVR